MSEPRTEAPDCSHNRPADASGGGEGPSLVNEFGRVECAACGISVLPENWRNHVLGKSHDARVAAGARASWRARQRELAATPPEPDTAGLPASDSEALRAALAGLCTACGHRPDHEYHRKHGRHWGVAYHPFYPQPAAARSVIPLEGLDVERLARAIEGHSHVGQPSEVVIACGRGHVERCAPAIAAEYARLTPAPGEAPDLAASDNEDAAS